MKKIALFFVSAISFSLVVSCNADTKTTEPKAENTSSTAIEYQKFGKEITDEGTITSESLLAALETKDSLFVKFNSEVAAVCKKKGCWMFVPLDNKTEMRVKFKDYDFFMPLNCEGKKVVMEGWAYKEVISVETLKHYALDGGADIAAIDSITAPETEYSFMADGVLMN